jgi:multiple sugar transport system substrate-binding protein
MIFSKKTTALPIAVVTLSLCFFSCGGKSEQSEQNGTITLKLIHWVGNRRESWDKYVVKSFEKEHPHMKIEFEVYPYQLYYQKLLTASASGAFVGDVVAIDDWMGEELFSHNYATDLQPYIERDLKLSDFFPRLIGDWKTGPTGDFYALPNTAGITVLYYSKDLFDASGVSYPTDNWTYDSLLVAAMKLTKDTDGDGRMDQRGFLIDNGMYTALETVLHSFGGGVLSDDHTRAILDDPRSIKGLQFWKDLIYRYKVSLLPSNTSIQPAEGFARGVAAMVMMGDVANAELGGVRFHWDFAMPPIGPDGLRRSGRFSDGLCIPVGSQHKDEAWELIKWIVTYPPRKGVSNISDKLTPVYRPLAESKERVEELGAERVRILNELHERHSVNNITPGQFEWHEQAMIPEIDNMLIGRKSVEQAAHDATIHINEVLKRRMESRPIVSQ